MSIFTTTQLGEYTGETYSGATALQAQMAIDQAIIIASALLQYDIDPTIPSTNAVPAELAGITPASCGTIAAGKYKKFNVSGPSLRIITPPFTVLRSVIFGQRGYSYAGLTTCTAGLQFVQSYQLEPTFNGKLNADQFNLIRIVSGFSSLAAADYADCNLVGANGRTTAFVDADWGWPSNTPPAAITGMVMALALDILNGVNNGGLKSESIEGHSYTFADGQDADEKYEDIISYYGAGNFNVL